MGNRQEGSVAAVAVALMGVTLLLGMAVLEREWASYILRLAQETADFAAEAGARRHDTHAQMSIARYRLRTVWETVCGPDVDADGNPICRQEPETVTTWSYPVISDRETVLKQRWRELLDCADSPGSGWTCVGTPQVVEPVSQNRWVQFADEAGELSVRTFLANWQHRSRVEVLAVEAMPESATRSVTLFVRLRLLPVVLPFVGAHEVWIRGRAGVQLTPLQW